MIVARLTADTGPTASTPEAWAAHWSEARQRGGAQRFFSLYRKLVFARTVRFFINRYFPRQGIFVEAGAGTAETSVRIDKLGGARRLVAVDFVVPILRRCSRVMDAHVGGDIFRLPLRAAGVDGLWNVGVMEHLTHAQIDQAMAEFHRVLRPGAPLLLLWPGATSVPQKLLRAIEALVNRRRTDAPFHFHPPEISQLRSAAEAEAILTRNGFRLVHIDHGPRSLFAFKTIVGVKS